jgi:penicillin-binding protein 2
MNLYVERKYVIGSIFILVILIYLIRIFYLQIIDISYKLSANNNVLRPVTQYPARGLIYDRKGKLMVFNEAAFDFMMIPIQVKSFDTTDLCNILEITREQIIAQISKAKSYSFFRPSIILNQLSSKTYAILQEKMYKYQGFFVQTRTLRKYRNKSAAHVLGYVGEVNDEELQNDNYYRSGDYIGKSGIEKSYENFLRGKKGVKLFLVDVHNRIKGSFSNGDHDTTAVIGSDLTLGIDAELQKYGEYLMQHKKGSVVAIEPATGEILTLVSSPDYDPGLLVGRIRSENYVRLSKDTLKPLFNRALMAKYPPGSTFKLVNALIGLQEEVITTRSVLMCSWLS